GALDRDHAQGLPLRHPLPLRAAGLRHGAADGAGGARPCRGLPPRAAGAQPGGRRMTSPVMIEARGLAKRFPVGGGLLRKPRLLHAVDGVDLEIRKGETFAIVGESGCGKSTLARLLMRLLEPTEGSIRIDGDDISTVGGAALKSLRRDVQFIFQDPFS